MIYFLSFIFIISLPIFLHELGHFLTARFFGIHVIRFKIGFGKTFFKFLDNKGTEFSLGGTSLRRLCSDVRRKRIYRR